MEQEAASTEQIGVEKPHVVKLSVFVPRTLHAWITSEAKKAGIPKSTFVRLIIMAYRRETIGNAK